MTFIYLIPFASLAVSCIAAISTPAPLPNPHRVITDTNLDTGISFFNTTLSESLAVKQDVGGSLFRLGYITGRTPNTLNGTDITDYIDYLKTASVPPITLPDGRGMMWYIDTPPGEGSPAHRTVSLDVVIQVAGEIEVTLESGKKCIQVAGGIPKITHPESGEKRIQKPGDMLIQRATTHTWKNPSNDTWARMVGVMYSSNPVILNNGTVLGASGL
ncbi:cupin domain protein [Aspergillus luchuensis]|uniref:Cupin domain protein n=1 Tax=Aspergillus kawachii TaxID=1069201 RepID=A0A146G0Y0_ASPKA|nr:cupin domain protein [Aspergillus luchuensis IFO 4308]GAT30531.1 cupin domain protein [Aspergillus luchuensis]